MKILVTGASGFIGSHLTERLISMGYEVNIFVRNLHGKNISSDVMSNVMAFEGDILDRNSLEQAVQGCEMIFHFAAMVGVDAYSHNRILTMETEEIGLQNLCHLALEQGCNKIIYPSSSAVYGAMSDSILLKEEMNVAPVSNYAVAKRFNEIYLESQCKENGLQSVSLRIFNVYGPRQDERLVIPRFVKSALRNEPIVIYGDGLQTRDFVYIDDVVESFIQCALKVNDFENINVATGIEYNVMQLAEEIIDITGSKTKIKLRELPENRSNFEVNRCKGATEKLQKLTGYVSKISFREGLERTCHYIEQYESY